MDRRIHILQLIYSFDVEGGGGGVARFAIALSQVLDPQVFEITICGLWNTGTDTESQRIKELNSAGIKAFTAANWDKNHPYQSLWNSYKGLQTFIQHIPFDIIHSHSEFSDIVTLMLKLFPGVPVIMRTLHNGYRVEWRKRHLRRILLSYFLYPLLYKKEIGVSKPIVEYLNQRWLAKLLNHHADLIHNAIDFNKFSEYKHISDKSILGFEFPKDVFIVGTIGRLREEKGYDTLLEAAAQVLTQVDQPVKFMIIGAGDLTDLLKAQAERLHISDNIIFTGPRSDIEFLLSGMDLFVSSSYWEGFSTAILEAMATKVPVLATDIPGNRGLIERGKNGWLVPSHDAISLASEIKNIVNLPVNRRQVIIEQAYNDVQAYSIEIVTYQYQRVYESLVDKYVK